LIVLSAMDRPVARVGLPISIEASGSITAGTVTSRILGQTDMTLFNRDAELAVDGKSTAP
jgi:L-cystine uptake protein TcyP (sodium:dicarboxylate symporter family)